MISREKFHFIIFTVVYALNYILHESLLNLIVVVVQVAYVLIIARSSLRDAIFLHLIFLATTITIPLSQFTDPGNVSFGLYNYAKFKLAGPISLSFAISLVFVFILAAHGVKLQLSIYLSILLKFFMVLLVLGLISMSINGLYGNDLDLQSAIYYVNYLLNLIIYSILLSYIFNNPNNYYSRGFLFIILLSPIISYAFYFIGIDMKYGNNRIAIATELAYFSPFAILIAKKFGFSVLYLLVSFCFFLLVFATGAMGGKGVLTLICLLIILALSASVKRKALIIIFFAFCFFSYENIDFLYQYDALKLLTYKVESAVLLLSLFFFENSFDLLPNSPKIRIYEILIILEGWTSNFLLSLFGSGFGGYFVDTDGLLNGIDLSMSYPLDEVQTNSFSRPHDTVPTFFHLHGVIGILLLFSISTYFIYKATTNYVLLSIIPFLLLSFYYNHSYGLVALFFFAIKDTSQSIQIGDYDTRN